MRIGDLCPPAEVTIVKRDGKNVRARYLFRDTRVVVFKNLATGRWFELQFINSEGDLYFKIETASAVH